MFFYQKKGHESTTLDVPSELDPNLNSATTTERMLEEPPCMTVLRQVRRGTLAHQCCMTAVAAAANTGALRSSTSTGSPRPTVSPPARSSRPKGCHVCCLRELLLVPPVQPFGCTMCCQTFLPEMSPRHAGAGDLLDHGEQQRAAMHVAAAVCSSQAGARAR